ncbi:acyltransferase family protein [Ruminococcus sp.]|uniref:acyltransferase family protein n=1 Tax=Ruminococcus sp. TaxID=41978 RepID=UPI0025D11D54|nr:acyltransferase family protein [Ruminococcus sp.]
MDVSNNSKVIGTSFKKQRSITIDFLKGLSIIAVVLYHFGGNILPYGYLGVDVFFVIGGYLLIKNMLKQLENNTFNFWKFIFRKIVRLWPLVIISAVVSVICGFFFMLPDDYENLADSAIASSVFCNNILQCITTSNYWDVVNLYKPLMHLWYVGVLMQAYIVFPLIVKIVLKLGKFMNIKKGFRITIVFLTVISFIIYIIPSFSDAWKFYYLPFRLFEISISGVIVLWSPRIPNKNVVGFLSLGFIIFLFVSRITIIPNNLILIFTVIFTLVTIKCLDGYQYKKAKIAVNFIAELGKRSYSIYIWHQVVIAFMFYAFFSTHSIVPFCIMIGISAVLAELSYKYIENNLEKVISNKQKESVIILLTGVTSFILCICSFAIYRRAGVIRDVPELNVYKNNVHRGMHAEYCDRPYGWKKEFDTDDKVNILVLGNSFGRDWANILYEWDVDKQLQVIYIGFPGSANWNNKQRIENADFVFYADGPGYDGVPLTIKDTIPKEKLYVVSNKNFGKSNGIIYAKRFSDEYFNQTIEISEELKQHNIDIKEKFGNHFIDLMQPVMIDDVHVKLFTDDNKFMSQDCRHLTQSGAQYYARILDIGSILNIH